MLEDACTRVNASSVAPVETVNTLSLANNLLKSVLTKSPPVASDIELSKATLIYYTVTFDVRLRHNQFVS